MKKKIFDSGSQSSRENMDIDLRLLNGLRSGEALLHFYQWNHPIPVTHGCFIKPQDIFLSEAFSRMDIAKRPTGGGIVFHNTDFAFSLLISSSHPIFSPRVLDNYHSINSLVIKSIERAFGLSSSLSIQEDDAKRDRNFCMAKISRYDVILQGKKVGGAAQRTTATGFLHQGTVFLSRKREDFYSSLIKKDLLDVVWKNTQNHSFYVLGEDETSSSLEEGRKSLQEALTYEFCNWR